MQEAEIEDFKQVGKLTAKVREESKRLIMVGESLLDIVETIEQTINEEGAKPAFPATVSINEIAAHYTPELGSEQCIGEKDVVKIDLGIEMNGALADTAYTIDLSDENTALVNASEDALANAIAEIKPGVRVGEIGAIIEKTIKEAGFKPIANLSGHMIKSNELHAGIDIPNVANNDQYEFKEGDIFAVEPFTTNGSGYVEDLEQVEIFAVYMPASIRMRQSRKIAEYVLTNYGTLPFAERWVRKEFKSRLLVSAAFKELLENHFLKGYQVLREANKGLVAQSEHTVLVTANGCEIITK